MLGNNTSRNTENAGHDGVPLGGVGLVPFCDELGYRFGGKRSKPLYTFIYACVHV